MGMHARVLAIGPFHRDLVPLLPRPKGWYATVRDGTAIIEQLCSSASGSTWSRRLAAVLGVEPSDFDTHAFDPYRVDTAALRAYLESVQLDEPAGLIVRRFVALRDAGFEFHFRPEG